jgi:hypothetical protein
MKVSDSFGLTLALNVATLSPLSVGDRPGAASAARSASFKPPVSIDLRCASSTDLFGDLTFRHNVDRKRDGSVRLLDGEKRQTTQR